MDSKTFIIGLIIILICIIPFFIFQFLKRKKTKQAVQLLKDLAFQHGCEITEYEMCGNYLIGADETESFLFFIKQYEGQNYKQFIDLKKVQICKKNESSRIANNTTIIEKLELVFIPKDKSEKEIRLEFYDNDIAFQLYGELQSIEKWYSIVNKLLAK
ncbi:MAG: hypothetical protein H6Q25_855 [Bacteroidetes bacterium]|nr:hypothetical protein [Bacteroidota bacterium]